MNKVQFFRGVRDCIPTLLGYLSIGFASGIIAKSAGLSVAEIALLSILVYAGSAQFIFAGMIASNHSAAGIVATLFFVNLRHLLLSAALSPYFQKLTPFKNLLIGSLLTDETFGVSSAQGAKEGAIHPSWMHGLNLAAYLNWIAANVAGACLGQWISDPERFGLDFALPAMFIGLLVLQMISRKKYKSDILVALCAIIVGVGCEALFGKSVSIIAATITAATLGLVVEKWR
ncbi:AzlC family ABC transporter permease [Cohnella pontilimi]|uniref:AzlC family ABC transporter permease n=1 Tax=Cohnella pontilimi TaxID=2564100 RepID=A0A4U0F968_9BACL|nr:AzlC family ABC transporter permease [Cohnella pontilimi]TJY41120.1 AzlC family ABC transporter permease [Cohnella pontilimi]